LEHALIQQLSVAIFECPEQIGNGTTVRSFAVAGVTLRTDKKSSFNYRSLFNPELYLFFVRKSNTAAKQNRFPAGDQRAFLRRGRYR
jgi:hypothetical protein